MLHFTCLVRVLLYINFFNPNLINNMKKVSIFMIAALAAVSTVFLSCSKDEADFATVRFNNVQNDKVTLPEGVTEYVVSASITSITNLKSVKINRKVGSETTQVIPPITSFPLKISYDLTQSIKGIFADCEIIVTVDNGVEYSRTLTIEYTPEKELPVAGEINTWSEKVLGSLAHASTAGSSCASIDGTVYSISEAKTNSAKVDFIYFNGSTHPKSLAAPGNASVGTLGSANAPGTWATKNATKLGILSDVTVAQFDDCDDDELITTHVTAAAVNADIVSNLASNNIVGFITAGGKKGLIKVISVDTSNDTSNSIKVSIKVQK